MSLLGIVAVTLTHQTTKKKSYKWTVNVTQLRVSSATRHDLEKQQRGGGEYIFIALKLSLLAYPVKYNRQ